MDAAGPTCTDAVTDPVAIKLLSPVPPPPVPGKEDVTNNALLTVSYITVLTVTEGE